jgi:hypothetical protein
MVVDRRDRIFARHLDESITALGLSVLKSTALSESECDLDDSA